MTNKINYIALTAGVLTILLIVVSLFVPWWKFTVGTGLAEAEFFSSQTEFSLLGTAITIPLIYAVNIASLLTLLAGGIVMLIYSVRPDKSYSKKLLGFAYKKPLTAVIIFAVGIIAIVMLANAFSGLSVPLAGAGTIQLPQEHVLTEAAKHQRKCGSSV